MPHHDRHECRGSFPVGKSLSTNEVPIAPRPLAREHIDPGGYAPYEADVGILTIIS
jgi:hypothetical protein